MKLPNPSPRQVEEILATTADLPETWRDAACRDFWRRIKVERPGLASLLAGLGQRDGEGFAGGLALLMVIEACLEAQKEE